jgi:hypothetical protein
MNVRVSKQVFIQRTHPTTGYAPLPKAYATAADLQNAINTLDITGDMYTLGVYVHAALPAGARRAVDTSTRFQQMNIAEAIAHLA